MKVLLIFLFIVLAGYLVIHMCGGFSARRKKVIRQLQGLDKSLMVLDNLVSLNDRDLSRLKGELKDLKNILEGGNRREGSGRAENWKPGGPSSTHHTGPAPAGSKLSSKALLEKIRREAQTAISDESDNRRPSGFIPKIIVINILLLIITILVMLI